MDSNHDQFSRAGNPWITPREQAEMQAQLSPRTRTSRKIKKANSRAKNLPKFVEDLPKNSGPNPRAQLMQVQRENYKAVLALIGAQTRTIKPADTAPEPAMREHGRTCELSIQEISQKLDEPARYDPPKALEILTHESAEAHALRTAQDLAKLTVKAMARARGQSLTPAQVDAAARAMLAMEF